MNSDQKTKEAVPDFAIIIPVLHSLEDLARCLASLDKLDYPRERFRVILIDCHVLNGLKDFFTARLNRYKAEITVLSLPQRPGISPSWLIEARLNEARNFAIQKVAAQCYVFTLDDCSFEPDWLHKFETALTDEVGALGGPDILPSGMGWFPRALDCVLNSYLGTAGLRRGDGRREKQYYPRKENMAIPARVFSRVGNFPEERPMGGDMHLAARIRGAGLQIRFLTHNPVWHRRVTTLNNFLRMTAYTASEKVQLARGQGSLLRSPHLLVLLTTLGIIFLGLFSFVNDYFRILLIALSGIYFIGLFFTAVWSFLRTCSLSVALGVVLLIPLHHLSIIWGIIQGLLTKSKVDSNKDFINA